MENLRFFHDLPEPPSVGRAYLEWHRDATGPLWAMADSNGWTFAAHFVWAETEFVVAELRVFPATDASDEPGWRQEDVDIPGRGLMANVVHDFPVGQLVRWATHRLTQPKSSNEDDVLEWADNLKWGGFSTAAVTSSPKRARRGRPPLDDLELAEVAFLYDAAIRSGEKAPIDFIAEQLDDPNPDRIRNVVAKSRKRGFLTPAPAPGQMGGHATEKAFDVLRGTRSTDQGEKENG